MLVIVSDPEREPATAGRKLTVITQFAPGATLAPQVLVWLNSAVVLMPAMLSVAAPVFVSVTDCEGPPEPIFCMLKTMFVRLSAAVVVCPVEGGGAGAAVPVPERVTVCGLPAALSVITTAPVRVLVAVGVNVRLMAQLAPAASDAPQVVVCAKSPVAPMPAMVRAALPLFESVTVCAALVVLIC